MRQTILFVNYLPEKSHFIFFPKISAEFLAGKVDIYTTDSESLALTWAGGCVECRWPEFREGSVLSELGSACSDSLGSSRCSFWPLTGKSSTARFSSPEYLLLSVMKIPFASGGTLDPPPRTWEGPASGPAMSVPQTWHSCAETYCCCLSADVWSRLTSLIVSCFFTVLLYGIFLVAEFPHRWHIDLERWKTCT